MTLPGEPTIIINGVRLNAAQAMTIHVALQVYAMDLQDLPAKDRGEIEQDYLACIGEINRIIARQ